VVRRGRRLLVLLGKNPFLALFRSGQQSVELCSPPQFDKRWISLKGGIGAVIVFDGDPELVKSGIFLAAESEDRTLLIAGFGVCFRRRFSFRHARQTFQIG